MISEPVTMPELEPGIETHGIERVSPRTRSHERIFDNFTLWLSANLVVSTISLGALSTVVFNLGFWESFVIIVLFNALGVLPVAFFSTLGPKLGLRQMTISRFSFGWIGGIITALFNVVACIGWSIVNVIIGGQLVSALTNGRVPSWVGVLVIAALTTIVSIFGYKYVHAYERFAWIPMVIIFGILFLTTAPHFSLHSAQVLNVATIAGMLSFGGTVYGFATGWSSYAADYNVNQPEETSASYIFWLTFLGVFLPCVLLETLGLGLTTIPTLHGLVGGNLLAASVKPLHSLGSIIIALLALSIVAGNIPNDYSLGLSVQVFGHSFQRINRAVWTLLGAIIYTGIALSVDMKLSETFSDFLLFITYWLGPWTIILVLEHFVFRHGHYNLDYWNTRKRLPLGWAAIISMTIGLLGVALGAAPVITVGKDTVLIVSPIARLMNAPYSLNIGFELGLLFAASSYLILRRIELNTSKK